MNAHVKPNGTVNLKEKGLSLVLNEGREAYFNYYWLRDNCPTSFDSKTRERSFDIFHLAAAPRAESAAIEGDHLVITWAGEGHVSRYPTALLALYTEGRQRPDPADLPRKAWFSDHYPEIPRFSQPELLANPAKVAEWLRAMIVEGLTIVTDMPDSNEGLTETVKLMGHVRPTFFGEYFDVKTHINPTNTAYTAKALELHTDTPAEEHAPGIQFLHCRANTVEGGLSIYSDGVAVANEFKRIDPEGFRLLSEIDIPSIASTTPMTCARASASSSWTNTARSRGSPSASTWPTSSTSTRRCSTTITRPSAASAKCCRTTAS